MFGTCVAICVSQQELHTRGLKTDVNDSLIFVGLLPLQNRQLPVAHNDTA